uniref:Chromosome segregation DNA-binding protein (ParB, spo0J) n=1 Tax=uncultured marine thaumarchaeote AD1000_06_A03 TaxID=1455884 RepID=A0A075FH46_9ARCH|nr:chromosome segregation DNA-binding protein (parB, spo0J) [uncultured marine thaumarchaeote AD1000_06_A03]
MGRRGLPQAAKMRHDLHYVDTLASSSGSPVGRLVSIDRLDPNPNQPRQVMGDLSELVASISEKGIIEPLIVRQRSDRFQIIAGERRYQAAVQAGLDEIPVIIRDVDEGEVVEIALIENIQRKQLTPFEESEALKSLVDQFSYTHEELARRLGKSRTSVTESLSLNSMPSDIKKLCRLADIDSKSVLLQIVRQSEPAKMVELIERLALTGNATRAEARKSSKALGGGSKSAKPFSFKFSPQSKAFTVQIRFRKSYVSKGEIVKACEQAIAEIKGRTSIS